MGFLEFPVQKESRDVKENRVTRECLARPGKQERKGHEGPPENQSPEYRVRKAFLGRWGRMVRLELRVRRESQAVSTSEL